MIKHKSNKGQENRKIPTSQKDKTVMKYEVNKTYCRYYYSNKIVL